MDLASAEHGIATMGTEPQRPNGGARNPGDVGDAALVAQARGGDREAFGTLVDRYADQARRVARAVLQDPDDADDAAQDAFLAALVKLDQYDSARPFGPWLMRIVANAATDRRRRRKVRSAVTLDEGLVAGGPRPDVLAEREVLLGRLRSALGELPERRRLAVVLFDVEGYSHAEIAQVLGIPEGTVRSEVFHARRKLRALLADWRDEG
jgi:RNA polymerase sigma-70 factor, ECF subfamily